MSGIQINEALLQEIDNLKLSERIIRWRTAMRAAPWKLFAEREKFTVASWRETEGEDIQLRRAKLVKNILDNVTIAILDFDVLVGRSTPSVIGACTSIDVCGDYIPDLWKDDSDVNLTLNASARLDQESRDILRESVRVFGGKTAPEMTVKAWSDVLGTWPKDVTDAKVKDPTLDAGIFGQVTSVPMWGKIISKGLRSFIEEAQGHIDDFKVRQDADINKLYFWQSAIIICQAIIDHAKRYARLAASMAENEPNTKRKAELLTISEICNHVPEYPARTFHDALQAMAIISACKVLEHPMHNNPHWGRGDQYLYPYFFNDVQNKTTTLEKASELLSELIGRWGTQIFVTKTVDFPISSE